MLDREIFAIKGVTSALLEGGESARTAHVNPPNPSGQEYKLTGNLSRTEEGERFSFEGVVGLCDVELHVAQLACLMRAR
jgi:hypothetical protein